MTPQIAEAFYWSGVAPPKPGSSRTTCPKCSHTRKPHHRHKACLMVTVECAAVRFYCHHCEWQHEERI